MTFQSQGTAFTSDSPISVTPTGAFTVSGPITVTTNFLSNVIAPAAAYGYTAGGSLASGTADIDRWPFASDTNSSSVGTALVNVSRYAASSSPVGGYIAGANGSAYAPGPAATGRLIQRFVFSSSANGSFVGALASSANNAQGMSSTGYGWSVGGDYPSPTQMAIQRFPFASSANATGTGSLTSSYNYISGNGISSSTDGYAHSGWTNVGTNQPTRQGEITKFPFATGSTSALCANMLQPLNSQGGASGDISGYIAGGQSIAAYPGTDTVGTVQKFPFATGADNRTSVVGYLTQARRGNFAGASSPTNAYFVGGYADYFPNAYSTVIDKVPFATDTNATSVGTLAVGRFTSMGHQG
jgi:hypothetical protein